MRTVLFAFSVVIAIATALNVSAADHADSEIRQERG
jgi:hypothetical protein